MDGDAGVIDAPTHFYNTVEDAHRAAIDSDEKRFQHVHPLTADLARSIEHNDFDAFTACLEQIKSHSNSHAIFPENFPIHAAVEKPDTRWLAVVLQTASTILDSESFSLAINAHLPPSAGRERGYAPIHIASKRGTPRHLQLLLDYGANPHVRSNAMYIEWQYILQIAIYAKNHGVVRFLVEQVPTSLNQTFYSGYTLTQYAITNQVPVELFASIIHQMQRLGLDLTPEPRNTTPIGTIFANTELPLGLRLEYFRLLLRADPHIVTYTRLTTLFSGGRRLRADRRMVEIAIAASNELCATMSEELRLRIREDIFFYGLLGRLLEWA